MKKLFYLTTALLLLILQQAIAQNGSVDYKAELHEVDCENKKMSMDISIKASDASSIFFLADQNYRLSHSRSVYNPVILEEFLSGVIPLPNDTSTLYGNHTLWGSVDTVISYNLELLTGTGILVNENEWLPIGRIGFDIAEIDECVNIYLHDDQTFPFNIITEMYGGLSFRVNNGSYTGFDACFNNICSDSPLPIVAENDSISVPSNQVITYDVLANDYAWENGFDLSSFHLLSFPPVSQMIVTPSSNPGEISLQPVQGFMGDVAPFEYKICNTADACVTAKVFTTVTLATSTTNPYNKDDIRLFPTTAKDYISVKYLNIVSNDKTQIAITDTNGRVVFQTNQWIAGNPIHRFDISTLPQGVYFLSTMIAGEWVAKKFIKI